jgi:vacuolar-type H+-ATPase subunit H
MDCKLTEAEMNHLRRLLGWAACEAGQAPEELVETVRKIAPVIGSDVSDEGKARLVEAHKKADAVPKYVRAAIKALNKALQPHLGDIVDGEFAEQKQLPPKPKPSNKSTPN